MASPPQVILGPPTFEAAVVRRELDNLELTHAGADLPAAVAAVCRLLEKTGGEGASSGGAKSASSATSSGTLGPRNLTRRRCASSADKAKPSPKRPRWLCRSWPTECGERGRDRPSRGRPDRRGGTAASHALLGSVSVTELAVMVPQAGGFYVYARWAFGGGAGFAVGWGDWINNCASLAYVTDGAAGYVIALLPGLAGRDKTVALAALAALAISDN